MSNNTENKSFFTNLMDTLSVLGNLNLLTELNKTLEELIKEYNVTTDKSENVKKENNDNDETLVIDTNKKENVEVKHVLPSSKVSVNTGLNIHKLVQEYIDTEIKPIIITEQFSQEDINNMYVGLYEFACWIINHK